MSSYLQLLGPELVSVHGIMSEPACVARIFGHNTPGDVPVWLLDLPPGGPAIGTMTLSIRELSEESFTDVFGRNWFPIVQVGPGEPVGLTVARQFIPQELQGLQAKNQCVRGHLFARQEGPHLYVFFQVEGEYHPLLRSVV